MSIEKAIEVIRDRDGNPHELDWELAEAACVAAKEITRLTGRVTKLEGMGPLIDEYSEARWTSGIWHCISSKVAQDLHELADSVKAKIDAILRGGEA